MRKLRWWIDCTFFDKHRYNFYTNRCIVCDKKLEKQSDEKEEKYSKNKEIS